MAYAIEVENLSKRYRIQHVDEQANYRTLRDELARLAGAPFRWLRNGAAAPDGEEFWALKDVTFQIKPGELVGVIGRNGAGKSTLLKILSRVTKPTLGRMATRGRVGSLLEVGTGFHPELSGRENVFLNGAILGMTRQEIRRKFDDIVAFAEIEKFLDTPVKRYSSGMYLRLAFAVSAHLVADILIVDEALAVGDMAFQKKCLNKMYEVAREGRTVLFVSHDMGSVNKLCRRVLLLVDGRLDLDGPVSDVMACYRGRVEATTAGGDVDLTAHPSRAAGCLPLLKRVRLLNRLGQATDRFQSGDPLRIEFTFDPVVPLTDPEFGVGVEDCLGNRVLCLCTYLSTSRLPSLGKPCTITCSVDELPLAPGRYALSLSVGTRNNHLMDALYSAMSLHVETAGSFFHNDKQEWKDLEQVGLGWEGLGSTLVRSHWQKG